MNKQSKEFEKLIHMVENEMAEKATYALLKGLLLGGLIVGIVLITAYAGIR